MADDAEGATKVAHVRVTGAESDDEAHRAARKVADSMLVKCSFNGEDPYWGRVVSELGSAGVAFDIDRVVGRLRRRRGLRRRGGGGPRRGGGGRPHGRPAHRDPVRSGPGERLGRGPGTDLGYGYIDENRTTS